MRTNMGNSRNLYSFGVGGCLAQAVKGATRAVYPAFVASLLAIPLIAQGQSTSTSTTLTVNSGRPLAEMIDKVQHLYMKPVDFEEAPYRSSLDLNSISIRQDDGTEKTLLATRIIDFTVTLGQSDSTVYNATQSVVAWYNSAGLPGIYSVIQSGDRVSVVPQRVRASAGEMVEVTPVMSAPVQFPSATRSVVETLQIVAQSVSSQTGAKVVLLNMPFHLTDTVTMAAVGEPAREVIESLGRTFGVALASQCLYDATEKAYYLNVNSIFPGNPAGVPPKPASPHSRPHPNVTNPFFVQ